MKILLLLITILLLMSCAGENSAEKDNTPPEKPIIISHLGDTGDGEVLDSLGVIINLNAGDNGDTKNGIDAEPDGNSIRVCWDWRYHLDTDLESISIFRFRKNDAGIIDLQQVSQVEDTENFIIDYLDNIPDIAVETEWFYFLEVFDNSGNSTLSDTVSYTLSFKPLLAYPEDGSYFSADDTIVFSWETGGPAIHYRLILFDAQHNYLWKHDEYQDEENNFSISYYGDAPLNPGHTYIWRVDAFGSGVSGSESVERFFMIHNL